MPKGNKNLPLSYTKHLIKLFFTSLFYYFKSVINEKSIDELITNAILEVDYGQSSAEDALTSLTQKLNENIASNYQYKYPGNKHEIITEALA